MKANTHPPVFHIGIPNPMFEGAINLYVIAGDPLTLIDTGIGTPEALQALEAGLAVHGLSVEQIGQIVLTHKHADHIGLARDLHDRSGAPVYVHEDDWEGVACLDHRHEEYLPLLRRRLQDFHVPQHKIDAIAEGMKNNKRLAQECPAEKLTDGQKLRVSDTELEVIHTPGHTQGSICLRFGHHLFSGDHVLPTISPNIGAGELRRRGMVQRYLDALDRVAAFQSDDLIVYPGHGPTFNHLAERAAQLKQHHLDREEAIVKALAEGEPKTVYEVAKVLWPKLPGFHVVLGTAEVNSHLEKACDDGRVREADGRFSLA